jgi:predicted SAM-dependent methyltransferase
LRVNLGCGLAYLEGWLNVDGSPDVRADVYAEAFDFVREHGAECDEIYMGHFLEHMMPGAARDLLALMAVRLRPGAVVSAVCPDVRGIVDAYRDGEIDNRILNEAYLYSYVQPSHHLWLYDEPALVGLFRSAGLSDVEAIDPLTWPPVWWKDGPDSRWQIGAVGRAVGDAHVVEEDAHPLPKNAAEATPSYDGLPLTPHEELLLRVRDLEEVIASERRRREELAERDRKLAADDRILRGMVDELRGDRDRVERERVTAVLANEKLQQEAGGVIDSRAYAVAVRLRQALQVVLPPDTRRRALASRVLGGRPASPPQ